MRARIGGAAARNGLRRIEARPSASTTHAVACRRAEISAYIGQSGDGRGVPRADVRVELRPTIERLRARFGADAGAPKPTSTRVRTCALPSVMIRSTVCAGI